MISTAMMKELVYMVDEVDARDELIMIVAACSNQIAADAAFQSMSQQRPNSRFTLRHGARIIKRSRS